MLMGERCHIAGGMVGGTSHHHGNGDVGIAECGGADVKGGLCMECR